MVPRHDCGETKKTARRRPQLDRVGGRLGHSGRGAVLPPIGEKAETAAAAGSAHSGAFTGDFRALGF